MQTTVRPCAQRMTFAEFREAASIHPLENHGRTAEVLLGEERLGFVDALGDEGLKQIHRSRINNALYLHSEFISSSLRKPALPTAEALSEYPDLIAKFPIAASILGFYVERNYLGMLVSRYCFPNEEERQTLRYILDAYGLLVERNERISLLEFADRIERSYDITEPRNRVAVEALRSCAGVSKFISH